MLSLDQEGPQEYDDKYDRLVGQLSFWISVLLATVIMVWYYQSNPPDTPEVQKMRLFFKENAIEIGEFFHVAPEELKKEAGKKRHPFFMSYAKASEVEKGKIRALYHTSTDYTPNQYWFNLIAGWLILFTTFWFIGLMAQGAVNLVRRSNAK